MDSHTFEGGPGIGELRVERDETGDFPALFDCDGEELPGSLEHTPMCREILRLAEENERLSARIGDLCVLLSKEDLGGETPDGILRRVINERNDLRSVICRQGDIRRAVPVLDQRIRDLEEENADLREEVADLAADVDDYRKQINSVDEWRRE